MPTYVRVKQPETGHEYSIVESALAAFPGLVVLDDKPATRADGTPLPVKPKRPLGVKASSRKSTKPLSGKGRKADNEGRQAEAQEEQ